ncbi:MAG: hypothetical protein CUN55_07020 [Phototrophicales bacterium]|nr:MAG: hypothetical protein CUN55_07020 [Phototrophicales bacterium]
MRRILMFFAGILAGSAAGAGIAMLFAPAAGKEMRASLRSRFQEIIEDSARAAATRRIELEAELDSMTTPPKDTSG